MRLRFLFAVLLGLPVAAVTARDFDLIIRHGHLIDGTGAPRMAGDIAVSNGRIVAMGVIGGGAEIEIDATGRVVAPGFIDVHTHTDDIDELPQAENFLRMGVTTLVTGNCGSSKIDIARFFETLRQVRTAPNVATLIGHNSVRIEAMRGSFARPPTTVELDRMRQLVNCAMQDGALGLSTGLIYPPGVFAGIDEITALAKVAARHGGIYASHLRHENARITEALAEFIEISRQAGIRAQVSHLKLSGPSAWGRSDEIVALLDRARAGGMTINHDQYVYTAASTGVGSRIPEGALEGGRERYRERIADPAQRAHFIAEMKATLARNNQPDYGFVVIASFPPEPRLNGRTVPEAAQMMRGADTLDDQIETILELEARGGAQGIFHGIHEDDLQRFLTHPDTMIGSDSSVRKFRDGVPHPRGYGNNARVLGHYVRELKLISLEEGVRKMTSLPATVFRLRGRGELRVGAFADLVVFDPQAVDAPATFQDPHQYAIGFDDVIVNGVPVIRAGDLTGARPGLPLRRSD